MAKRGSDLVSLNGDLRPASEAQIHALTPAVKFGLMVFETLRGYWNQETEELYLFRLDDHLARLRRSAALLHLGALPEQTDLRSWVLDLVRAKGLRQDCALRIQAAVETTDGKIWDSEPLGVLITAGPRGPSDLVERGARCRVSSWRRSPARSMPPRAKCAGAYLTARQALLEARSEGLDGAILLNSRGLVAEGPLASLFLVFGGRPVTPDLDSDILDGITRDSLIRLLADVQGTACLERSVERDELRRAEEALFCSTGMEVTPIVEIDGTPLGDGRPGPLTRRLSNLYGSIVRGQAADDGCAVWRTPVYTD